MNRRTASVLAIVLAAVLSLVIYQLESIRHQSAPFVIEVTPVHIRDSVVGQTCVFLVTIEEDDGDPGSGGKVILTVEAPNVGASIHPRDPEPGEVAEIWIRTTQEQLGKNLTVIITGKRGTQEAEQRVTVWVDEGEFDVSEQAATIRDLFIPWLEVHRVELGITSETEWQGMIVTPHNLVVTHQLFFSEEWEMHVYWHVTIEPHNWAKMSLRRRFEETEPSLAFMISSWTSPGDPVEIEPEGLRR